MKLIALTFTGLVAMVASGCGGSSTVDANINHSSSSSSATGRTSTGGSGGAGTSTGSEGTSGTSGGCYVNGRVAGAGNGSLCCSGVVDGNGVCYDPNAGGSTSSVGSVAAAATGTTTGGTCPSNIPNLQNGVTQNGGTCVDGELGQSCPPGFTCVNSQCILNGGASGLQIALSWDVNNYEDLDLHVVEPDGCAIWYENTNRPMGSARGTPACSGSLDRDSNAGCPGQDDGVNIENVIYPSDGGYPSGTYKVVVDYWENCDGKTSTNYAVQVRNNGQVFEYCGTLEKSQVDECSNGPTCPKGVVVTTFTVP